MKFRFVHGICVRQLGSEFEGSLIIGSIIYRDVLLSHKIYTGLGMDLYLMCYPIYCLYAVIAMTRE